MATLLNTAGRVISFLGGYVEGKQVNNGFRLVPTVRTAINDELVERIKSDKIQSRVMAHYIAIGEIVDVEGTFADLTPVVPKPAPVFVPVPEDKARFVSTTAPSAIANAARDPVMPVDTSDGVALDPPAPAGAPAPQPALPFVVAPTPAQSAVPAVERLPVNVASLESTDAIALAGEQAAVPVLGDMWTRETAGGNRADVIAAIVARANALNAQAAQPK